MKNIMQTLFSAALITSAVISSAQAENASTQSSTQPSTQSSTILLEIKKDDELNSVCHVQQANIFEPGLQVKCTLEL